MRVCLQPGCGAQLYRNNKSGYCTKHHREGDRIEPRFCQEPGCGKRLRSDSQDVLCLKHRLEKSATQQGSCKECGKPLRQDNSSGYCTAHFHLSRSTFKWDKCREPGCDVRVNPARNKHGYCREHRHAGNRDSTEKRICRIRDCGRTLASYNKSGFCRVHSGQWWKNPPERKFCKVEGCGRRLGNNNKSGLCPIHHSQVYQAEHKEAARRRMRAHRDRQQATLAEAKRVLALGAQPAAAPAPRGRPIDEETFDRITVAAFLKGDGLSKRAMARQVFPRQVILLRAQDSTKKLFKDYAEEISNEQNRLAALSESERSSTLKLARSRLA
jgi:hypothetical protein